MVRFDLLQVLVNRFDVALDHAVRLEVGGCDARLAHSQALQNLLYQLGLGVTALFTIYLPLYFEAPEEVGNQRFRYWKPLGWVWHRLPALGNIIHSDQEVSVSLVALCGGSCYINGYPFEQGPDVVLMHLVLIPGAGAATGCRGVALLAPLLDIISCLEPVVTFWPYPGSCWHPSDLLTVHHVHVRSACRSLCSEGELSGLFLIVCRRIPSGHRVCRSSQRGIFIGPSSCCM
jgi:hypothetical protein